MAKRRKRSRKNYSEKYNEGVQSRATRSVLLGVPALFIPVIGPILGVGLIGGGILASITNKKKK